MSVPWGGSYEVKVLGTGLKKKKWGKTNTNRDSVQVELNLADVASEPYHRHGAALFLSQYQ